MTTKSVFATSYGVSRDKQNVRWENSPVVQELADGFYDLLRNNFPDARFMRPKIRTKPAHIVLWCNSLDIFVQYEHGLAVLRGFGYSERKPDQVFDLKNPSCVDQLLDATKQLLDAHSSKSITEQMIRMD